MFFKCGLGAPVLDYLLLNEKYSKSHIHLIFSLFFLTVLTRIVMLRLCPFFHFKSTYGVWKTETIQPVNVLAEC